MHGNFEGASFEGNATASVAFDKDTHSHIDKEELETFVWEQRKNFFWVEAGTCHKGKDIIEAGLYGAPRRKVFHHLNKSALACAYRSLDNLGYQMKLAAQGIQKRLQ